MIEWISVIALIVIGIGLVIIEVLFVPGTTIVGILGLLATAFGVYLSFEYFGSTTGWLITGGSSIFFLIAVVYSFKSGTWDRFSLKGSIDSRVNEDLTISLKAGDIGKAVSVLRPVGKAEFEDKEYEVTSLGDYIEDGTEVRIIKIEINKIFVETV